MKFPVCENCVEAEELCPTCAASLQDGKLSAIDVAVSHVLGKIKRKQHLENVDFVKALDLGKLVIIVATGKIGVLIGRKGKIVTEVSRELGKRVRVIEHTQDEKKMIQDLVGKAKIVSFNKVFNPEGQSMKVVIAKADAPLLAAARTRLEQALQQLLGIKASIEFQ